MASALNNAFKNSLMEKFSDINSVFKGLAWDDFSPARLVITRARQTGKSYEKAWMDEFLNTPGASTENKQSMLEINLAASLKALKDRTAHSINAEEIKEIHMPIEDEELDDQTDLEADLADLAAELTATFDTLSPDDPSHGVTLLAPENLTVERAGRGYRTQAHMGGEAFLPRSAYLGSKRRIIVVFKPLSAEDYEAMEMSVEDAISKLHGFDTLIGSGSDGYLERMKKIAKKATAIKDKKVAKAKGEDYGDTYGSF